MIVESVVTVIGIACSIPALVSELSEEFTYNEWSVWAKLAPQILLLLTLVFRSMQKLICVSLLLSVLSLLATYFCFLFNSQTSSSVICEGYSNFCADIGDSTCEATALEPWEGLSYLVGLCFMTIGSTIFIKECSMIIKTKNTAN